MKNVFSAPGYALISPIHLQAALARVPGGDFALAGLGHHDRGELAIAAAFNRRADTDDGNQTEPWWKTQDAYGEALPAPEIIGSTAVIPVKGMITSGLPSIYRAFGYADTEEIAAWVRAAADDPDIDQILLAVDSPGGMVGGTPELGDAVDQASKVKPVTAHSKGMMDSAAYWIASQATAIFCTPSADIGCIGVYQVNYDYSGMLKEMGVKAEMIKSGDLKGAGHPAIPLSDDQRNHLQAQIDLIGAQFRSAVTAKRTMVEPDSMRGQSFLGTEAAERHLVAGLRSFESLL